MCTDCSALTPLLYRRRASLFGHVARLKATVPAHQALWWLLPLLLSSSRTRTRTFVTQIQDDVGKSARSFCDVSTCRGRGGLTQRSTTTWRRRWWWFWESCMHAQDGTNVQWNCCKNVTKINIMWNSDIACDDDDDDDDEMTEAATAATDRAEGWMKMRALNLPVAWAAGKTPEICLFLQR